MPCRVGSSDGLSRWKSKSPSLAEKVYREGRLTAPPKCPNHGQNCPRGGDSFLKTFWEKLVQGLGNLFRVRERGNVMETFMLRAREGILRGRFGRLLVGWVSVVAMVVAAFAIAPGASAAELSYDAPAGTAQAWVDVEAADVAVADVSGSLDGTGLSFSRTAAGVAAVVPASAGRRVLSLTVRSVLKVRLAVTFADGDGVVLAASDRSITLEPGSTPTPTPTPPNGGGDNGGDNGGGRPSVSKIPVYRVYNRNSGLHHYTVSVVERDLLVRAGWNDEGIAFNQPTAGTPVYRAYNPNDGNHHWTVSKSEYDSLKRLGWHGEGVAWYQAADGPVTVWRAYNPGNGEHLYTVSNFEYKSITSPGRGWKAEGIAWKTVE